VAHGVIDDGHDVEVGVGHQVRDVAVDEHFARAEAGDGFGGDTRVGAACWRGCRQFTCFLSLEAVPNGSIGQLRANSSY
jgi:hypothetical protein